MAGLVSCLSVKSCMDKEREQNYAPFLFHIDSVYSLAHIYNAGSACVSNIYDVCVRRRGSGGGASQVIQTNPQFFNYCLQFPS